jgi:SAM-dependent methyltransferase
MLSLERQESYRRRYAAAHPGWQPASAIYRDWVAAHLAPGVRVLDLGCGRGGVLEELAPRAGLAVGADPDPVSLRQHRLPTLPRVCAGAEALPYPDCSFDLICCSWVLEHLPDPQSALRQVARLLAPGGRFVFLTPNSRNPLLLLNRTLGRWAGSRPVRRVYGRAEADTFPAFYRANTPARLRALLRAAGLQPVRIVLVSDPTYLALNDSLYRLAVLLERLVLPAQRVHLVGEACSPLPSMVE